MIEQTYFLDMIPGESAAPVVHVSQFDVNSRTLTFNLMKGGVAYEPDAGMTVTLDGTKPDNTAFSYPMTVDGSSVSIALQPQMTVLSGHVRCEVTVSNASGQIGSANFILAVEESAIDTGAISDTDIPIFEDLKNQAQQAAAEATAAAQTVSAILPENVGTVGQVLTRTGTGAAWDDVDGLPAGGTVGQVLTKQSSTDGDADWETPASGGTWGSITGTLSDQTDLQNALDAKSNIGNIATIESSPASANHAVGEFIVYNGQMYSVIDGITAGQALTPSNISATSAGDELSSLKSGLTALENGSGQGITMIDTSHFNLTHSTVFKIGSLLVGTVILQCTSNFTNGDLFRFNDVTLPYYNFGIGAVTAGQWSYDVSKSVRIYFKSDGVVSLTSNITSGQFITIPVCLKAN